MTARRRTSTPSPSELGHAPASAAWLRFVYTPDCMASAGRPGASGCRSRRPGSRRRASSSTHSSSQIRSLRRSGSRIPEEPGALDLATALARRSGADLVIANDPDGDRLAVAIPDASAPGGYRQLTGDQVGALLGAFLLSRLAADPGTDMARQLVVSTVVSGSLLAKITAAAGAQYAQTLTGFKWIVRAADPARGCKSVCIRLRGGTRVRRHQRRARQGRHQCRAGRTQPSPPIAWSNGESLQDAVRRARSIEHGVHLNAQVTLPTEATVHVMSRLRAFALPNSAYEPVTAMTDYSGGNWELPPPTCSATAARRSGRDRGQAAPSRRSRPTWRSSSW